MRRSAVWVLLLMGMVVTALRAEEEPRRVTIAGYNLQNMFDVFDDPYTTDETTRPKSRSDLTELAKAIRALNADVIGISELENEGVLKAFAAEFLGDMNYRYVGSVPSNSGRGITLGVLSRLPIHSITSHRFRLLSLPGETRTWTFARDVMRVTIQATPTQRIEMFVVHLKSRHDSAGDPTSAKWRLAEAVGARALVDEVLDADPQALVAFLGDFNDTPGSDPLNAIMGATQPPARQLTDVHAGIEPEKRITYLLPPYRSTIDYILTSPALTKRLVPGSATLLDDESLLRGSDHAPIKASFKLD